MPNLSGKPSLIPRKVNGRLHGAYHPEAPGKGHPKAVRTSDHISAKLLYPALPSRPGATLIGVKGYDSDEYRDALNAKGISACIQPRKKRKPPPNTAKPNTNSAIKSKICSANSKAGDGSQHAMIEEQTSPWPQSHLPRSSYGGFNES